MKTGWILFWVILLIYWVGEASPDRSVPPLCFRWISPTPTSTSHGYDLQGACLGGDATLLTTGVWLSYNATSTGNIGQPTETYLDRVWIDYNTTVPALEYQGDSSQSRVLARVEYTFVQPEHGGGKCHCFRVFFSENCNEDSSSYGG